MEDEIIIPTNMVELQEFLEDLWDQIFKANKKDKIKLYNKAADQYNKAAGRFIMQTITDFAKQKKAASLYEQKQELYKAPKKSKVVSVSKNVVKKERSETEPTKGKGAEIIALARQGLTIDQIVAKGYLRTSTAWYFAKFKLRK